MNEYLELQQVMKEGAIIADIEKRDNRVYFKIDSHQFSTFGDKVIHENHPLFNHPFANYLARIYNTAEGIAEEEEMQERIEENVNNWIKYRLSIYKTVILSAVDKLVKEGEEAFVKHLDHYLCITEEGDNCQKIIELLKQKEK